MLKLSMNSGSTGDAHDAYSKKFLEHMLMCYDEIRKRYKKKKKNAINYILI